MWFGSEYAKSCLPCCGISFCLLATSQAYQPVWTESIGCFTSHGLAITGLIHSDWVVGKLLAFHWLSYHSWNIIGWKVHRMVTTKHSILIMDWLQGNISGSREWCFIPACQLYASQLKNLSVCLESVSVLILCTKSRGLFSDSFLISIKCLSSWNAMNTVGSWNLYMNRALDKRG